jgi:hypothetical protein
MSEKQLERNYILAIFHLSPIHFDGEQQEATLIDPLQEVGSVTGGQ